MPDNIYTKTWTHAIAELASEPNTLYWGHCPLGQKPGGYGTQRCELWTILRHPVDRVISAFYFHHGYDKGPMLDKFRSCIDHICHANRRSHYSNLAVQLLGYDRPWSQFVEIRKTRFATRAMLDHAKWRLRNEYKAFALYERVADSIALFSRVFGINTTHDELEFTAHRSSMRRTRADIPSDLIDLIVEKNQLDIELYEYAVELFDQLMAVHD